MATNPSPLTPKTKNKINSVVVMLVFAVFLGLLASFGIWQYLSQTQEKVKRLTVTRAVVVAARQIPAGTKLSERDLSIKQLPTQVVPKDYPSSVEAIKQRIAKTTIQPQEVITESRLIEQGAKAGLPFVIPPGQRAITIRVNEISGIGGFINPGDHVDIVSVLKGNEEKAFSKTILQNVLVIAAGDKIYDPNNITESQPKVVSQITVALHPKDAEKLALAAQSDLHLVLRPNGEGSSSVTSGVSLEDVYGYLPSLQERGPRGALPMLPATSTAISKDSIEVILGSEKTYFYY